MAAPITARTKLSTAAFRDKFADFMRRPGRRGRGKSPFQALVRQALKVALHGGPKGGGDVNMIACLLAQCMGKPAAHVVMDVEHSTRESPEQLRARLLATLAELQAGQAPLAISDESITVEVVEQAVEEQADGAGI